MATAPSLTPPYEGAFIDNGQSAYVKRQSAVTQAGHWNAVLRDDPVCGPSSGYMVTVGPLVGRRYVLVWSKLAPGIPDFMLASPQFLVMPEKLRIALLRAYVIETNPEADRLLCERLKVLANDHSECFEMCSEGCPVPVDPDDYHKPDDTDWNEP